MEKVKATDEYTIYQKRSKRHAVKSRDGKWLHGEDKVKVLLAEKLIKQDAPKPKAEPEPESEAAGAETTEAPEAGDGGEDASA